MYTETILNLCFPLMSRTIIYFHVYIILDFPITYRNASMLCQSECACLHKTVNMVVFLLKVMKRELWCECTELYFIWSNTTDI